MPRSINNTSYRGSSTVAKFCYTIIIAFVCYAVVFIVKNTLENHNAESMESYEFSNYIKKYKKTYNSSEYFRRQKIFERASKDIERLNQMENISIDVDIYGYTKYTDWTSYEFEKNMLLQNTTPISLCKKETREPKPLNQRLLENLPQVVDWRSKGIIGPIVDQKMCRGCWAITVTGATETMVAVDLQKNGTFQHLNLLSIQELIDCSKVNDGCRGGKPSTAVNYLINNKIPIVSQLEYPLKLVDEPCKLHGHPSGVLIKQYKELCNNDEEVMLRHLADVGPLIAAVNAKLWQHYSGGVIRQGCLGNEGYLNHVILIVGYNLTAPVPYYIIKNSWGVDYGDHGYVKVAIGGNVCGIADEVSYIIV
ncbi:cathepsin O-like [Achroia grisella]|uniref:cathepsin O-like n=1 Tax=Achroia grisella TaxID=688607 RepID=UPI0027D28983|nr:cathepsin O-like [Achroia grisella]